MAAAEQLISRFVAVVINPAILLIFAAGFFMFIWGLVQFIFDLEDGGKHEEGKEHMKWGIIGMLVMMSVYGIISVLDNTFDLNVFGSPDMSRIQNVVMPNGFFGGN